jgi:hypothetical protein
MLEAQPWFMIQPVQNSLINYTPAQLQDSNVISLTPLSTAITSQTKQYQPTSTYSLI